MRQDLLDDYRVFNAGNDLGCISADTAHHLPTDVLVEIGPGQGAITYPLLRAAGRLTVIELDRDLVEP